MTCYMIHGPIGEGVLVRVSEDGIENVKNPIYAVVVIYKKKRNADHEGRLVKS